MSMFRGLRCMVLLGVCAGLLSACNTLGPDAIVKVDSEAVLIGPAGGCHSPFWRPLTHSVCGEMDNDRSAAIAHPFAVGAERQLRLRIKGDDILSVQVSLLGHPQAEPVNVLWTHTYDGNHATEDLSELPPGVYVAEVFAVAYGRRNSFYRFGLELDGEAAPEVALPASPVAATPTPAPQPY